jgi:nucleoside-diphosphate-sugar epimerase
MRVLIAGCGWLGRSVGATIAARGARVWGVRRTSAAAVELERAGISPLVLDLARRDEAERLPDVDAVVACPAPAGSGVAAYRETYVAAIGALLARYPARDLPFVYTSSTGVFARTDGAWVDERTPVDPATATAAVLVEAERQVLDAGGRVLRLSGLYGPQRYGILERVRTGRLSIGAGEQRFMNLCHREDATRAVTAALERGSAGATYHASDAEPVRRGDLVRWIAARLGIEPHASEVDAGGPDRRIDAAWSRAVLGTELAFPTFREGLAEPLGPAAVERL